eukprot:c2576_g1_i1.p1 GENE.c2576_g1_i1~~c2576_g1_i1.p1  ORF type:complete len:604 (+),score=99.14 c2576_g1_i1:179-1813(+)
MEQVVFFSVDVLLPLYSFRAFATHTLSSTPLALIPSHWFLLFGVAQACLRAQVLTEVNLSSLEPALRSRGAVALLFVASDMLAGGITAILSRLPFGHQAASFLSSAAVTTAASSKWSWVRLAKNLSTLASSRAITENVIAMSPSMLHSCPFPTNRNDVVNMCRQMSFKINYAPSLLASRIRCRRSHVLVDSTSQILIKDPEMFRSRMLRVSLVNEDGVDFGAISREWITEMGRQISSTLLEQFQVGEYRFYQPHRRFAMATQLSPEYQDQLECAGRVFAKSLYEVSCCANSGMAINVPLSENIWNFLTGKLPDPLATLEHVDPHLHSNLMKLLNQPLAALGLENALSFSIDISGDSETSVHKEFLPGGDDLLVTDGNKHEYARLYAEFVLYGRMFEALTWFARGFQSVLPSDCTSMFDAKAANLMICGLPNIDVGNWIANTVYCHCSPSQRTVMFFWQFVESLDQHQLRKLLKFVTGSMVVPANGFGAMMPPFKVTLVSAMAASGLPMANVCDCELLLPPYSSLSQLREKFLIALENCNLILMM